MPVMDGYETTRKIREHEAADKHVPIIALTAHAMKGADNECRAAGMDDYLSKPIDREQLQQSLNRWLNDAGDSSVGRESRGLALSAGDASSLRPHRSPAAVNILAECARSARCRNSAEHGRPANCPVT